MSYGRSNNGGGRTMMNTTGGGNRTVRPRRRSAGAARRPGNRVVASSRVGSRAQSARIRRGPRRVPPTGGFRRAIPRGGAGRVLARRQRPAGRTIRPTVQGRHHSGVNPGSTNKNFVTNADTPLRKVGRTSNVTNVDGHRGFGKGTGLG